MVPWSRGPPICCILLDNSWYLKADPRLNYIQRNVVAYIESPRFRFELPKLPLPVLDRFVGNRSEAARLGFAGDAHISSAIATELLRCYPEENPGFYTRTRTVLVANSTFAHLMKKLGHFKPNDPVKIAGDAFEAILAAFYAESGRDEFHAYIKEYFVPLIVAAGHAYRNSDMFTAARKHKKNRHIYKSEVRHHSKPAKRPRELSTRKRLVSATTNVHSHPLKSVQRQVNLSDIIDLTLDTDSEEERTIASMLVIPSSGKDNEPSSTKAKSKLPKKKGPVPQRQAHSLVPPRRTIVNTDSNAPLAGPSRVLPPIAHQNANTSVVLYPPEAGDIDHPIMLD